MYASSQCTLSAGHALLQQLGMFRSEFTMPACKDTLGPPQEYMPKARPAASTCLHSLSILSHSVARQLMHIQHGLTVAITIRPCCMCIRCGNQTQDYSFRNV